MDRNTVSTRYITITYLHSHSELWDGGELRCLWYLEYYSAVEIFFVYVWNDDLYRFFRFQITLHPLPEGFWVELKWGGNVKGCVCVCGERNVYPPTQSTIKVV